MVSIGIPGLEPGGSVLRLTPLPFGGIPFCAATEPHHSLFLVAANQVPRQAVTPD